MYSMYGDVQEAVPHDVPTPLGKEVITITYEDINLYHDMITGHAVTGILHLMNSTLIDWYSKRQDTIETATYGSEFVAARIATVVAFAEVVRWTDEVRWSDEVRPSDEVRWSDEV